MPRCPRCFQVFHGRGFLNHIRQSKNTPCAGLYEAMQQGVDISMDIHGLDMHGMESDGMDVDFQLEEEQDVEVEVPMFAGDYFSDNYGPEDFPGFEEALGEGDDSSSSESEDSEAEDKPL